MNYQHRDLAAGRWHQLSLVEQLANVGSEVERTIKWRKKNNQEFSDKAFFRALELLQLTKTDPKNLDRIKEICRANELLIDYFAGDNAYNSSDMAWQKYFHAFTYSARLRV
jgi:hypothetical protein